jgi:hypothetical protein
MNEQLTTRYRLQLPAQFFVDMTNKKLFPFPSLRVENFPVLESEVIYNFPLIVFVSKTGVDHPYPSSKMIKEIINIIGLTSLPHYCKWHSESLSNHLKLLLQGVFSDRYFPSSP